MWTFLLLLFIVTFIASAVGLFFKTMQLMASWIVIASFVGILFSNYKLAALADQEAQQQGFLDAADIQAAKDAGIFDPAEWQPRREQLAKQRQEAERAEAERANALAMQRQEAERAKAEDERIRAEIAEAERAKAEVCERDLQCIGNEKSIEATFACRPWVERMAKNDFQWTDSWSESKFARFRWRDKTNGVVTYMGDKIKFQNGFGAWVRSIYECDYNFRLKSVADVRAREGQFPPD